MKGNFSLYIFNIIIALCFFTSCERYVDTFPPVIEFFLINDNDGKNGEVDVDTLSTDLEIRAFFRDESSMLSYTISFEYIGGDDSPGLRVPAYLNQFDTFPVAGAQTEIFRTIRVASGPDSDNSAVAATGDYNVHMDAKDVALNNAQRATIAMEFRNYTPFYKFSEIEQDSTTAQKDVTFPINFILGDLDKNTNSLSMEMFWLLYDPDNIENGGITDSLIQVFPVATPTPGNDSIPYNESFVFPDTGNYELRFKAGDERRNETNANIFIRVDN
ncbi:hypothetical protein [Flammeovirga aprica]|uniref:DUF5017 domain-containing protein n=1 Tax=Flammeovirga aprica JL-4 TaxID=694437 RepID=A0A7X9RT11_9BACT|nr:hypothetical protein [Flammeovirga aprica]NME67905.1 hypothetical protein [Flammeovirga aprica JL-4]